MPDTGENEDYKEHLKHSKLGNYFLKKSVIQTLDFSMTMDNV